MNNNLKILVVEDEIPLNVAARLKLERNGFEVDSVRTLPEALEAVVGEGIHGIWLDHYLISGTGLDLIDFMKQNSIEIPIFVVSNTDVDSKRRQYIDAGVVSYFIKSEEALQDIIEDIKSYFFKNK